MYCGYRRPRTTQERRANQSKNDPMVRGRRHAAILPNSYDDIHRHVEKGWKRNRRQQYHLNKSRYGWHEYYWDIGNDLSWHHYRNLIGFLESRKIFYRKVSKKYEGMIIRWFGPEFK